MVETLIDACVHAVPTDAELRAYFPKRWREWPLPRAESFLYVVPRIAETGDDPSAGKRLEPSLGGSDAGHVVLLPIGRGLLPDADFSSAICAAINSWLAEYWLEDARACGSIRVNPLDPAAAVREIEKWSEHPRMVQVAVPLQSHAPYGSRRYLPIWQAAVDNGLPIAFKLEVAAGIDLWPTAIGYPTLFSEYASLARDSALYHIFNFITEGVLDRLPELRLVFADGGHDMLAPFLWRLDKDWRPYRIEVPWARKRPIEYVQRHVRFIWNDSEGPIDAGAWKTWDRVTDFRSLVMYGRGAAADPVSHRDGVAARVTDADARARLFYGNANDFYEARGIR